MCQGYVCQAVANDKRGGKINTLGEVTRQHGRTRFPVFRVLLAEASVNKDLRENHTFTPENVKHFFMWGKETFLGKSRGSQAVLVGNHNQFEICFTCDG